MRRGKMRKGKSRKVFKKNTGVHSANFKPPIARGGIRF